MEMILKENLLDFIFKCCSTVPNDAFLKPDRKAQAPRNLCIDNSKILHIQYDINDRHTWNKLDERANLSCKLFLQRKLYASKISEDGNVFQHIPRMLELVEKLKGMCDNRNKK